MTPRAYESKGPTVFHMFAEVPWEPTPEQVAVLEADMVGAAQRKYGEPGYVGQLDTSKVVGIGNGKWKVLATVVMVKCGACNGF